MEISLKTNKYINKLKELFIIIIFIISIFSSTNIAQASNIYMSSEQDTRVGDILEVSVYANTDEEIINSIDFVIDFPEDLVEFSGYRESDTSIGLWVSPPSSKDGKVYLSGVIPGGIQGIYDEDIKSYKDILLTKILFNVKKDGLAKFSFIKADVLKHDGQGTTLNIPTSVLELNIQNQSKDSLFYERDVANPMPFDITFIKKTDDTPALLYFKSEDIGSGIYKYEIKIGNNPWIEGHSPVEVKRSILSKKVLIKAYDFSGNYVLGEGKIPGIIPTYVFIVLALLILGFLTFRVIKYKL
ncbi:MAG: hypothetical protein KBB16_00380 [Candidatus Pacebacteria bacterium]|nr:hypothetical protein [Candidatus Paceibacterota bacterium]